MKYENPKSSFLDSNQLQRINNFFNNASIHIPNKYVVGLYGSIIKEAIQYLLDYSHIDPLQNIQKKINNTNIYTQNLYRWLKVYCPDVSVLPENTKTGNVKSIIQNINSIELLWACESISFEPSVTPSIGRSIKLDTYKNISYPYISGHDSSGEIKLTIVEDRNLMFYQFFNGLMNQFFDPLILKAKSSIHRLGLYIIVMGGYPLNNDNGIKDERKKTREKEIDTIPLQVYEFNSIVLNSIGTLTYSYSNSKASSFTVSFNAPNFFQDAFKTTSTFRGLRNNTSNLATDNNITKNKTYNVKNLEDNIF